MTTFAHILNLNHVDSAGADPLVFYASTSHNLDLTAGTTQHVPCLAAIKPKSLLEEVVDGYTVKAPQRPRSVTVTPICVVWTDFSSWSISCSSRLLSVTSR